MECLTMDTGLPPHAFPFDIHHEFCQEIYSRDYLDRLVQVGVPQDYVASLSMLPSKSKNVPRSFIAPSTFYPSSAVQLSPSNSYGESSADKVCVFAASDLMFQDAMASVAPSAKLIGAGMLTVSSLYFRTTRG